MESFKSSYLAYVGHFHMTDYIAFAWLVLLFFVFLFLAILLARGRPLLAMIIVILDLALLGGGPFGIKYILDSKIRDVETKLETIKQLTYSDTLILQGTLQNRGKVNFNWCKVHLNIYPKQKNGAIYKILPIKSLHERSITIETPPKKSELVTFELVWENIRLDENQSVVAKGECY